MSISVKPPRRSALGVAWHGDFSRGWDGIARADGIRYGVGADQVSLDGRWAEFHGANGEAIIYPPQECLARDEITCGVWYKDIEIQGESYATFVGQWDTSAGSPTGRSWAIRFRDTSQIYFSLGSGGGLNNLSDAITADQRSGVHLVVCRWKSGSNMDIYFDGELLDSGGSFAGTLDSYDTPLSVGRDNNTDASPVGQLADPFVEFRYWSEEEIRDLYRGSLFR